MTRRAERDVPLIPGAEPFTADGDRLGILVLHGFTGSPVSVKPWAEHLAAAGHTVAAPRLPGHGTRWQDLNAVTWEDWFDEAQRNLAWLRERTDQVVAMGLSMGATLSLRLAEVDPGSLAGLVLVNPLIHTERPDRHLLPYIYRVVPAFPGISNDIKKPGVDEGGYNRLPLRAAYSMTRLWATVKSEIHKVTQPLLVLRSADDHVVEPSNSAWILANVGSTQTEEIVLHDSYHVATLDNDAEMIFDVSLDFARSVTDHADD
ncbi:MAG: alpha/beta fold hydrolase [Candidatus Nanopelagicales bacterium]